MDYLRDIGLAKDENDIERLALVNITSHMDPAETERRFDELT